jgi:hypothetical protein
MEFSSETLYYPCTRSPYPEVSARSAEDLVVEAYMQKSMVASGLTLVLDDASRTGLAFIGCGI